MPWKETSVFEQRKAFIEEVLDGKEPIKAICGRYGISEKTGHKWKRRFMESDLAGLADESRAPRSSPGQLGEEAVIRIIAIRQAHPTWGPKKIAALYGRAYPGGGTPRRRAASTGCSARRASSRPAGCAPRRPGRRAP